MIMKGWYGRACLLYLMWFDFALTQFCPPEAYFFKEDAICIWLTKTKADFTQCTQPCGQDGGSLIDIGNEGLQEFISHKLSLVNVLYWIRQIDANVSGCSALLPIDHPEVKLVDHDESLQGICFKPLECPPASLYFHETDTCYWVDNNMQSAWIAQKSCASKNGSLAVIPTPTVMYYIIDIYTPVIIDALATSKSEGMWIGYTDCAEEGVFRTFDGMMATWFAWLDKQPNDNVQLDDQDCVIMTTKGFNSWEDKACEKPRIALCYRTFSDENGTATTGEDPCPVAISTVTAPIDTETTSLMTPAITTSLMTPAVTTSLITSAVTTSQMTPAVTTSLMTPAVSTLAGNTSDSKCQVCKCGHTQNLLTAKELLEHLERLRLDTHIYYKNTSAYRRRHVSVYEPRIMAKCMGVTAGAVLVAVVLCLVILDLTSCRAKQKSTLDRLVRRL